MKIRQYLWFGAIFFFFIFLQTQARGEDVAVAMGGVIRGCATYQGYLYVAQRDSIIILDVRDKKKIHEIARYNNPDGPLEKLTLKWPVIFYIYHWPGSYYHRIRSIDVTSATQPLQLKFFDQFGNYSEKGLDFITSGSTLLIDARGIHRFDISNPLHPIELEHTDNEDYGISSPPPTQLPPDLTIPRSVLYSGNVHNVMVIGKRAYVADEEPELKVFDVSDPRKPQYLGTAKDSDKIKSQMASKKVGGESNHTLNQKYQVSTAYKEQDEKSSVTLDYNHLLNVEDMTRPEAPKTVATVKKWMGSGNGAENMDDYWISGNLLNVVGDDRNTGGRDYYLEIYDLSKPTDPVLLVTWTGFDRVPEQVCYKDGTVYIAGGEDGLTIISSTIHHFTSSRPSRTNP